MVAAFHSVNAALHQSDHDGDGVQLALIEELRKEYMDILKLFDSPIKDDNTAFLAFERCEAVLDGDLFTSSRRSCRQGRHMATQPAVVELQQAFLTLAINLAQSLHLEDSTELLDLAMEAVEWFPKDPLMWLQLSDCLDQAIHQHHHQGSSLRYALCKRLALLKAQSMLPLDVSIPRAIQHIDHLILHTSSPNSPCTIQRIAINGQDTASNVLNQLVIVARPIVHDILQEKTPILDVMLDFELLANSPFHSPTLIEPALERDQSKNDQTMMDSSSQSKSQREARSNRRAAREQTERSKIMPLSRIVDRITESLNQAGNSMDDSELSQMSFESSNITFEKVSGIINYDPSFSPPNYQLVDAIIGLVELLSHAPTDAIWSLELSQGIHELVVDILNPLYQFFIPRLSSHALLLWLEVLSLPNPMADSLEISTLLIAHLRQALMMDLVQKESLYIRFIWCQFCITRQPDLLPLLLQGLSAHPSIISFGSNGHNQLKLSIPSVLSAARQLEIDLVISKLFSHSTDDAINWRQCAEDISNPAQWLLATMKHIKTEPLIKLFLSIPKDSATEASLNQLTIMIVLRLQQTNIRDISSLLVDSFFYSIPDSLWISLQCHVSTFCAHSAIRTFHMLSVLARLDLDLEEDCVFHLIRDHILAEKSHIKTASCSFILENWLFVARKLNSFILEYAALRVIAGTPSLDFSDPWNLIKRLGDDSISAASHQIITLDHCFRLFSLVHDYIQTSSEQIDLTRQTLFADAIVSAIFDHLNQSSHYQQLEEHCHHLAHFLSSPPLSAVSKAIPQYHLQPSIRENMRNFLDAILWKLELLNSTSSKRRISDQTLERDYFYAAVLDVEHQSDWLWDLGLLYHNELNSRLSLPTSVIIDDAVIISSLIVKCLNSFLFCPLHELAKQDCLLICQLIKSMTTGILSIFSTATSNSSLTRPDAARIIMKLTDSMQWTLDLCSCQIKWYRLLAQKWLGMPLELLWQRRLNILKVLMNLPESSIQQDWLYHVMYKLINTSTDGQQLEILTQIGMLVLKDEEDAGQDEKDDARQNEKEDARQDEKEDARQDEKEDARQDEKEDARHDEQKDIKTSLFHALGKLDHEGKHFRHLKGIAIHSLNESDRSSAWSLLIPSLRSVFAGKKTLSGSQLVMPITVCTPDFTADYYLHYEKIITSFASSMISTDIGQLAISLLLKRLVSSDQIMRRKSLCIRLVSLLESVNSEFYDRSLSLITSCKF